MRMVLITGVSLLWLLACQSSPEKKQATSSETLQEQEQQQAQQPKVSVDPEVCQDFKEMSDEEFIAKHGFTKYLQAKEACGREMRREYEQKEGGKDQTISFEEYQKYVNEKAQE